MAIEDELRALVADVPPDEWERLAASGWQTLPTGPGYYWWREDVSRAPEIVLIPIMLSSSCPIEKRRVYRFGDGIFRGDLAHCTVEWLGGEWNGPLREP